MTGRPPLVAVDGVNGAAVERLARARIAARRTRRRPGISRWDASGVFEQLAVADSDAGAPTPRTLLLLYAADLAFRLRWEIEPALAEGRAVIAAPYVDTAIAFGVATGLPIEWLRDLFSFVPAPAERQLAPASAPHGGAARPGFIQFASRHGIVAAAPREIARRAGDYLRGLES